MTYFIFIIAAFKETFLCCSRHPRVLLREQDVQQHSISPWGTGIVLKKIVCTNTSLYALPDLFFYYM